MNAIVVVLAAIVAVGSCNYYGGGQVLLPTKGAIGGGIGGGYYGGVGSVGIGGGGVYGGGVYGGGVSFGSVGKFGGYPQRSVVYYGNDYGNGYGSYGSVGVGGGYYGGKGSFGYAPVVQSFNTGFSGGKFGVGGAY